MSERLPVAWVDEIFARLNIRYGKSFMNRWDGISIDHVKADWCEVLAGLNPQSIKWAFDNMDAVHAPTAAQFRDLAFKAPKPVYKPLPAPTADKHKVESELAKLSQPVAKVNTFTDWIARGIDRLNRGEKVSPTVAKMIRAAAKEKGIRA